MRPASRRLTLISGATSGIGRAAAGLLARRGHRLLLVGRNAEKTAAACREIRQHSGNPEVHPLLCDFSSPAQIARLAARVRREHRRVDVLVNNAGVVCPQYTETPDGIEMTFAVNHLGYFLLTALLWDCLGPGSRVVNVASRAHFHGRLHLEDVNLGAAYGYYKAYAQSKLANLLFTFELAARAACKKVAVNVLHPGVVATNIWPRHHALMKGLMALLKPLMSSPETGAKTVVLLADAPEVEGVTGAYFEQGRPAEPAARARDPEMGRRLWALSHRLTGLPDWKV